MPGFRALPPPLTVEDTMDDVALTSYCCPKSAFDFDGWNGSQSTLPQLMARQPPAAITAPSTDSDPDHVIDSTTT